MSDLSFMIQNIEGKLTETLAGNVHSNQTPGRLSLSTIPANTSAKRRRISETLLEDHSYGDDLTEEIKEVKVLPFSKGLKLQLQIDELKLQNEQLTEQVKSYKSEYSIFKEQSARQMKFLEELNTRYKQEAETTRTKYYEEKKKWQMKVREVESEHKKFLQQQQQQSQQQENSLSYSSSTLLRKTENSSTSTTSSSLLTKRIEELENSLITIQEESRQNLSKRLSCEEEIQRLLLQQRHQGTTTAEGTTGASSSSEAYQQLSDEYKTLRRRYSDLETLYRRRNKEQEKMQTTLKNQQLLEVEVANLREKEEQLQHKIERIYQPMEQEYHSLKEERRTWHVLFCQPLVTTATAAGHSHGSSSASAAAAAAGHEEDEKEKENITAMKAVQLVQNWQQELLLMKRQSSEQTSLVQSLQHHFQQATEKNQSLQSSLDDKQRLFDRLQSRYSLLQQQSSLFTQEITSLRALLKTYDFEFTILPGHHSSSNNSTGNGQSNKLDIASMLAKKEAIVDELRAQMDTLRQEVVGLSSVRAELQEQLEAVAAKDSKEKDQEMEEVQEQAKQQMEGEEEKEGKAAAAVAAAVAEAAIVADQQIKALEAKYKALQSDYKALQEVTGLDFLPDQTRIVHFLDNPSIPLAHRQLAVLSSVPNDRMQATKKENQELKAKLAAAQQSNQSNQSHQHSNNSSNLSGLLLLASSSQDHHQPDQPQQTAVTVNTASSSSSSSSSSSNNQIVADQMKLNQRLKEMFKEKITTFREAVYVLTGYKMELYSVENKNRLKLKSMYAESPEDFLLFQLQDDGQPELLESDYANHMDAALMQYLTQYKSIPAFLANLTLSLFENQTMM